MYSLFAWGTSVLMRRTSGKKERTSVGGHARLMGLLLGPTLGQKMGWSITPPWLQWADHLALQNPYSWA